MRSGTCKLRDNPGCPCPEISACQIDRNNTSNGLCIFSSRITLNNAKVTSVIFKSAAVLAANILFNFYHLVGEKSRICKHPLWRHRGSWWSFPPDPPSSGRNDIRLNFVGINCCLNGKPSHDNNTQYPISRLPTSKQKLKFCHNQSPSRAWVDLV